MSRHLQRDLEDLEQELLAMSARVDEMLSLACRALAERRGDLAAEAMQADVDVDQQEVHIEEVCLKILALHQPVANDLRLVTAVLKINNDLERIADLAVNMAERAARLTTHPEFTAPPVISKMAQQAAAMVRDSIDAFVRLDARQARNIIARDAEVDHQYHCLVDELYGTMTKDSRQIKAALHCYGIVRGIERIADHATNISEDVVYLVEGEIARHKYQPNNPL
jgi:phosphate transport system protein